MTIVRVFGNTALNTHWVGKVTMDQTFTTTDRTTITKIFDQTGLNVLLEVTISVLTNGADPHGVRRDNHAHAEIFAALRESRDAVRYDELKEQKNEH